MISPVSAPAERPVSRDRRPVRSRWGLVALWALVSTLFLAACDRLPDPNGDVAVFTDAELAWITDELNARIASGDLTRLDTGVNLYRFALPGWPEEIEVRIVLERRTIMIPFGFADVWLNDVAFEGARVEWDGRNRALHVRLDVRDNPRDGLLADVTLLGVEQRMEFPVTGARFDLYLIPRVDADGRLTFDPIRVKAIANTDDAKPFVRAPLRDALAELEGDLAAQLNAEFDRYREGLLAWVRGQFAPNVRFVDLAITDGEAVLRGEPGPPNADVDGNGVVDIADLVAIGRAFGQEGPPGFSPADVTGDGVVDIRDLVTAATRFGQRQAYRTTLRLGRRR